MSVVEQRRRYAMMMPGEVVRDGLGLPLRLTDYGVYMTSFRRLYYKYLKRKGFYDLLPKEYRYKDIGIIR